MKRLQFQLKLLEPALLTAPGGDPNTDESVNYIPGSVLRGALAHKYRQANLPSDAFTRLFLDGTTRFFNGYLARKDVRMLPTPAHWRREKDPSSHDPKDSRKVHDLTKVNLTAQAGVGKPFMQIENSTVYTQGPQHEIAVHNARNREMGRAIRTQDDDTNRSALFRYHALAKGQTFVSYILVADQDVDAMQGLLTGEIWLGGSKSAGYGRTQITSVQINSANGWRELNIPIAEIPATEPFFVYLTSDAIIRDPQTGQHGAFLCEQLANLLPGHTLKTKKSYGRFDWVGGFNQYWGLPLPQTWSMLKGTMWLFISDQSITTADIQRIEQQGIGDRRAEGFGSLLILPQDAWPKVLHVPDKTSSKPKQSRAALDFPELSKTSEELLKAMNERIAMQQLDRRLMAAVNQMRTKGVSRLSNSQLARLQIKVWQEKEKPEQQFKRLRQYLRGTTERKAADDQFRKSRFQGRNFRDWLLDLAGNPAQVWQIIKLEKADWEEVDGKWQRPLLGKEPFPLDDKLAHEYAIRLITAVCDKVASERRNS